jgi:hypothetical protein
MDQLRETSTWLVSCHVMPCTALGLFEQEGHHQVQPFSLGLDLRAEMNLFFITCPAFGTVSLAAEHAVGQDEKGVHAHHHDLCLKYLSNFYNSHWGK